MCGVRRREQVGAGQGPQGWGRDSCRHTSEFTLHAASSNGASYHWILVLTVQCWHM